MSMSIELQSFSYRAQDDDLGPFQFEEEKKGATLPFSSGMGSATSLWTLEPEYEITDRRLLAIREEIFKNRPGNEPVTYKTFLGIFSMLALGVSVVYTIGKDRWAQWNKDEYVGIFAEKLGDFGQYMNQTLLPFECDGIPDDLAVNSSSLNIPSLCMGNGWNCTYERFPVSCEKVAFVVNELFNQSYCQYLDMHDAEWSPQVIPIVTASFLCLAEILVDGVFQCSKKEPRLLRLSNLLVGALAVVVGVRSTFEDYPRAGPLCITTGFFLMTKGLLSNRRMIRAFSLLTSRAKSLWCRSSV